MVEDFAKASFVLILVLGLGLVYVGEQVDSLGERVDEIDHSVIETGVTIDNGAGVSTETVHLTRGASGLEALQRVAEVGTKYYQGMGTFIESINGLSNDSEEGKNWIYYVLENGTWTMPLNSAGDYELEDGENIKFSYEESPFENP